MVVLSRPQQARADMRRSTAQRILGRDYRLAWLFLLPLLIVLLGLITYPFFSAIILSMQRKMVGAPAQWVGLGNYRELLFGAQYGTRFHKSVLVSFLYVAVAICAKFTLGMSMALLLNERFPGRAIMRAILFLPWAMPSLIVALAWRWRGAAA